MKSRARIALLLGSLALSFAVPTLGGCGKKSTSDTIEADPKEAKGKKGKKTDKSDDSDKSDKSDKSDDDDDQPYKQKVTAANCEVWGDKFSVAVKKAFADNMKKCGKKATKDGDKEAKQTEKEVEEAANKSFDELVDKQTKELIKGCKTQAGKDYLTKDAKCYLEASKIADWGKCKFETPFFQDFSDLGSTFDKTMQESCDDGIEKAKDGAKKSKDDE